MARKDAAEKEAAAKFRRTQLLAIFNPLDEDYQESAIKIVREFSKLQEIGRKKGRAALRAHEYDD